jgi:O-antigen/teichoic acid export membrane protein
MLQKVKSFLFENTSVRQTVAKNTFWLAVSNFGGRFLRAFVIIYAARVLGPAEWGVFNYAITITAFLTLFVDFGIVNILIRERARVPSAEEKQNLTATAFWTKLAFSGLGMAVVAFVAPHLPTADVFTAEKSAVLFPIVAFIMLFDTMREFFHGILRSEERMEWDAAGFLLTNVFIVGWGFFLLSAHPTVRGFTFAYALGTGMGCAASAIIVRKHLAGVWGRYSGAWAKKLLQSAWPFAISGVLGMLMINTDIVMLGWFRTSEEVGFYSAPQRIIQLIYLIPSILAVSILPVFSRLALADRMKMRTAIERSVSAMFCIALPVTAGGIITAHGLVGLLFGTEFLPGALPLQILLLTLLADFSAIILSHAILAYDRQRDLIAYAAIGGFLNVALNLVLIPRFGIVGCAVATLCAQLASNAYLRSVIRRLNPIRILPHLGKALIATAVMSAGVYSLQYAGVPVLVVIISGGLIYGAVLYLLREPMLKEMLSLVRNERPGAEAPSPHQS